MNILWWLLIGFFAGAIARLLVPGRDPMGWIGTLALGLAGSLVGGWIGMLLTDRDDAFSPAGLLGSIAGAVVALLVYRAVANGRSRHYA